MNFIKLITCFFTLPINEDDDRGGDGGSRDENKGNVEENGITNH